MSWNPFKKAIAHLWSSSGAAGYPIAANFMIANNLGALKPSRPISDSERPLLEPPFGFLDRVRIHFNATLLDAIGGGRIGGFEGPQINQHGSDGQTFGFDIYIRPGADGIQLIAHELVHVRQFVDRGESLAKFGYDYFRGYYEAGQNYPNNRMENEAYSFVAMHFP